ncbi:uncharacterized protein LOC112692712 [Sipha flava]|uniref:Uncharacterized protein LOC112692712 n=1 Tax=Sipha flava TaxID=143950 RepID=A0A2S2QCT1_9HEMI|nr:uncharacterized protein LOC112692712 [Sipha flava]
MSSMRKNNLLVKNTGMSLNDRFTQIQQKSKTIGEDEILRKHRILSFGVERRSKVAASLLMNQDYVNRDRLRVPFPPLPPPRPEINNRMYNNLMHDMIRSTDRLGVPVHERLALGRVPVVEDRRRIRRRRGLKNKVRESVALNVNTDASNANSTPVSRSRNKKRQTSKQRDPFPRKEHVYSKEDLDEELDQFMSHTKQKRDEELNRVIQEHS